MGPDLGFISNIGTFPDRIIRLYTLGNDENVHEVTEKIISSAAQQSDCRLAVKATFDVQKFDLYENNERMVATRLAKAAGVVREQVDEALVKKELLSKTLPRTIELAEQVREVAEGVRKEFTLVEQIGYAFGTILRHNQLAHTHVIFLFARKSSKINANWRIQKVPIFVV